MSALPSWSGNTHSGGGTQVNGTFLQHPLQHTVNILLQMTAHNASPKSHSPTSHRRKRIGFAAGVIVVLFAAIMVSVGFLVIKPSLGVKS